MDKNNQTIPQTDSIKRKCTHFPYTKYITHIAAPPPKNHKKRAKFNYF